MSVECLPMPTDVVVARVEFQGGKALDRHVPTTRA